MKARKEALDADVVVINHHLFFADVTLRDEGLAELLPACNTVILDEAHQLPDTATLFFGEQTTAGELAELARDAEAIARSQLRDVPDLPDASAELVPLIRKFRLAAGDTPGKFSQQALAGRQAFRSAQALARVSTGSQAVRLSPTREDVASLRGVPNRRRQPRAMAGRIAQPRCDWIHWMVGAQSWQLHASPLSVADVFRRQVDETGRAWIFTSATLAVGRDFSHYTSQLGLGDAATGCWDSPFDYPTQGLLYVPRGLPAPNSIEHTNAVVDAALPVLKASGGRAFLLFTTLRALTAARERLTALFERDGLDFPVLVQGEGSKTELLLRFRALGNAVLLGSASFWEGVDVPGDALSVVVIDKLPFAPPDDPLLAARLTRLAAEGGNAFMDWQLPQAAISLKQGAGRLIRTETDRGVLMVCDPRIVDKPYGRKIWQSLPAMKRTRDLADVVAFFQTTPVAAAG